jgi:transcriptional regulator with XRE-family HTH domain
MSKKQGVELTAEQNEMVRATLAAMDAEYQGLAREAAELAEEERAKPVEESHRWWTAYTLLEEQVIGQVKAALDADGKSQADLARTLGVSRARVSQILTGEDENFKMETIAKLATALDRDVAVRLIKRTEEVVVRETSAPTDLASILCRFFQKAREAEAERRQRLSFFSAYRPEPQTPGLDSTTCKVIEIGKAA